MILQSGKEVKITQCQIWAVWRIFQDCPPEALQELCVAVATWGQVLLCISKTHVVSSPGHCHLMAACNRSRVAHYVTALTDVAFSMKSTNHTTLRSQNTTAITLSGLVQLELFGSRGLGMLPVQICMFCLREWRWTDISYPLTMHSRKTWPWMAYC